MSAAVLPFRPPHRRTAKAAPTLPAPQGGDVYLVEGERGGWIVIDMSPSGGSAGSHGWHAERADALAEGRELARRIGGTFLDDDPGSAA